MNAVSKEKTSYSIPAPIASLKYILYATKHELRLSYRFIWRDLTTTIIPAAIFTIAALKFRATWTPGQAIIGISRTIIYTWLYIYSFCLANQIAGYEEDRINKPDRPLSAGLVSGRGAQVRWGAVTLLFAFSGWLLGVWPWALLWIICVVLYNFLGWSRHWFLKNGIIMPIGTVALLVPAWEFATSINPLIWRWICLISSIVGLTVNLQDLRDMTGDRKVGRKTMPIVWGEWQTRILLSVFFILQAMAIHFGLMVPAGRTVKVCLCAGVLAAMNIWIAVRVLICRSAWADHKTYMLYTYWFCCVLASAIVVL